MKTQLLSTTLAILASAAIAQDAPPADPPELTALDARAREFEAAYAKSDANAIAAMFTEDAVYTSEDGREFPGREAILAAVKAGLGVNKGSKLAIQIGSVRVVAPGVVVEKGASTVTRKNGETARSLYTAVQVRKDGKWCISELTESVPPAPTAREHLEELAWLAGAWTEKDGDASIDSKFQWARNGNFMTRNVTVKRGEEILLEGFQIIGWDPVDETIRSWTFDAEGGFSEGAWTGDGRRWLITESGFTPEGGRTTAQNTIARTGDDKFTWESNNRTLNGDPQPGIPRVEIVRAKGK